MEQRNGRIDRKLQPRDEVFCHYFVYTQRREDRVLKVLVNKTETIKKELGSLSRVVEGRLAGLLKQGIRHDQADLLAGAIEKEDLEAQYKQTVEEELEASRQRQDQLQKQIDRLRNRLGEAKKWIGLEEGHFRSALSCALELMGAEPLQSSNGDSDGDGAGWTFPALDQRKGADPTWADTLDTLRVPREREQKPWEWRRDAPIRPVVFADPGTMEEEVVHLHLEHRVAQRLLGRFRAQGFVHHDLSRACLAHTGDTVPRVILLGRLCLYGPGAARLHEELISVTARWVEPSRRKSALRPYGRDAEAKTLDLLEQALLPSKGHEVSEVIMQRLLDSAAEDVDVLLAHLQERGEEMAQTAQERLEERGEREALAMQAILEGQKIRVEETAEKYDSPQLSLHFDQEERRQLEANQRHWAQRLQAIDRELDSEPERIRQLYQIRAQRIEPVGLVVSPPALLAAQAHINRHIIPEHRLFLAWTQKVPGADGQDMRTLGDLPAFVQQVLGWDAEDLRAQRAHSAGRPAHRRVLSVCCARREYPLAC